MNARVSRGRPIRHLWSILLLLATLLTPRLSQALAVSCGTAAFSEGGAYTYNVGALGGGTKPFDLGWIVNHHDDFSVAGNDTTWLGGWFQPSDTPYYWDNVARANWQWMDPYVKWSCTATNNSLTYTRLNTYSGYAQKISGEEDAPCGTQIICDEEGKGGGGGGGGGGWPGSGSELWCTYYVTYNIYGQITSQTPIYCWWQ
jgi:hypothetical protein